eukprot:UN01481
MTWPSFLFGMLINHVHRRLPQSDWWIYAPDLCFLILFGLVVSAPCEEPCEIVVAGWMYHMIEGPISTFCFLWLSLDSTTDRIITGTALRGGCSIDLKVSPPRAFHSSCIVFKAFSTDSENTILSPCTRSYISSAGSSAPFLLTSTMFSKTFTTKWHKTQV